MHRVAVVGASGFAGALAAHIVQRHPGLELTAVTARSEAGRRLDALYPRYRVPLELEAFDPDRVAERADAAIVGYPHGAAATVVEDLRRRDLKVVDLSADFRLDQERYEVYYQPHEEPGLLPDAVFRGYENDGNVNLALRRRNGRQLPIARVGQIGYDDEKP